MALNQTSQPGDNNSQEGSGDGDFNADSAIDVSQHETMDGAKPRSGIMTTDELTR